MIYVISNNEGENWHVAKEKLSIGAKGTVFGKYYVAACSGKQLGGAWGYSTLDTAKQGQPRHVCQRCRNILAKVKTVQA